MKNRIINVSKNDLDYILKLYNNEEFIIIDIDGKQIKNKSDFFEIIEKKLNFPGTCDGLWARFDDWITDLSWIEEDKGICIVIKSFSELANSDIKFRNDVIEDFENNILTFWEHDVLNTMVGGTVRNFIVIISDL